MKRILKWAGLAVVVVLVLVGVVLTAALRGAGPAAREAVLHYGPAVTGAPVELDAVDISALTASAAVRGLVVGNPEGYESRHALRLDEAAVDIEVGSLFGDVLVLESVRIDGAHVIWEGSLKGSNLTAIKANAEAYAGPAGAAPEPAADEEAPETKVIIRRLAFLNTRVGVQAPFAGKDVSFTLPDVVLEDIGVEEGGVPPGEVGARVTSEFVRRIAEAVAEKARAGVLKGREIAGEVKDKAAEAGDKLKEKVGEVGKTVEGLKNVFGR
jgi:hypothetical protein